MNLVRGCMYLNGCTHTRNDATTQRHNDAMMQRCMMPSACSRLRQSRVCIPLRMRTVFAAVTTLSQRCHDAVIAWN